MQAFYMNQALRSVADVSDLDGFTFEINRINVPAQHRGFGHGSELLRRITADADAEGVTLVLHVYPSGPLDFTQLADWYKRHGFDWAEPDRENSWEMVREPR